MLDDIYSGVPSEYRKQVEEALADEPDLNTLKRKYGKADNIPGKFSVGNILKSFKKDVLVTFSLVLILTVLQNIGPFIFSKAVDLGLMKSDFPVLAQLSLVYVGIVLLRILFGYFAKAKSSVLSEKILFEIRLKLFTHLQSLSDDFYKSTKAGHIISRMTSDINALAGLFQNVIVGLLVQILSLVFIIGLIFYINATLASVLLLTVLPPMAIVTIWFKKRAFSTFGRVRDSKANVVMNLRESIYGIRQIISFNRQGLNIDRHSQFINKYNAANSGSAKLTSMYAAITGFIEIAAQSVILIVGYMLAIEGKLTVGEIIAFNLFLSLFFGPLEQLTFLFRDFQEGLAAMRKISKVFRLKPSVVDAEQVREIEDIYGTIRFHDVSFGYKENDTVIDKLNLEINAGQKVAILGSSGAGKSTLIKLINRTYDASAGEIFLDGININEISIKSLRKNIGVVQQDPFIFKGTIRENIAFANPNASEDQILDACKRSCLVDILNRLPDGLDTQCGERGGALSAGERQLIAIARVFLSKSKIILFDEATSSVDSRTEKAIEESIKNFSSDCTIIIVTHKLDMTASVDRVYLVKDKNIKAYNGGKISFQASSDREILEDICEEN